MNKIFKIILQTIFIITLLLLTILLIKYFISILSNNVIIFILSLLFVACIVIYEANKN